ncbi:MAG: NAD(P)/FAD-dependent oxidoreductase, partial [Nitrospirota bacterium]
MARFNVIIVGTGPAGIFSAWELLSSNRDIKVLMIDKGASLADRIAMTRAGVHMTKSERPDVLSGGWGGAGAFSDGKLNL